MLRFNHSNNNKKSSKSNKNSRLILFFDSKIQDY